MIAVKRQETGADIAEAIDSAGERSRADGLTRADLDAAPLSKGSTGVPEGGTDAPGRA